MDKEERFFKLIEKYGFCPDYPLFKCDNGLEWIPDALEKMADTIMAQEDEIKRLEGFIKILQGDFQ